jgi:hypothetical protein
MEGLKGSFSRLHFLAAEKPADLTEAEMKILLQDSKTGLYCAKQRRWTEDESEAFNFPSCLQALSYGRNQGFEAEIVMKFSEEEVYDLRPDLEEASRECRP